jgi:hypothetical protein
MEITQQIRQKLRNNLSNVWECGSNYFSKWFLLENILK